MHIFLSAQTYLSGLTQKTQQARSLNFEEQGDISVSSGAHSSQARRVASPRSPVKVSAAGSKFLKKKKSGEPEENSDEERAERLRASTGAIVIAGGRQGIEKLFMFILQFTFMNYYCLP